MPVPKLEQKRVSEKEEALKKVGQVSLKENGIWTQTHIPRNSQGEDSHLKVEADIGSMLPQATEHLELLESRRILRIFP